MTRTVRLIQRHLVRLRDQSHFSDADLARVADLSRSDVSRFTNGHVQNPTFDFLEKLCAALGVSLVEMMQDVPVVSDAYSTSERELIMRLRRMTDEQRETVVRVARALRPDD